MFVTYILLFSSFAALFSTTAQLIFEYRRDIAYIKKTAAQIEKSHKAAIIQALWSYDTTILEAQLQGIKNYPDVSYVSVWQEDKILLEIPSKTVDDKCLSYKFPLVHSHLKQRLQIGILEVRISLSAVYQRLWDRVILILFTQTLKTFMVSIFIFFLFYFIVGRHLKTMAEFARSVHLNNLDKPLVLKRKRVPDELGVVESAINNMRVNLVNEIDNFLLSQKLLEESKERFKSLVTNIPGIVYRCKPVPMREMDFISEPIKKISGYPAQDFLTGKINFTHLIHQKDYAKVLEKRQTTVKEGEPYEIEYRILRKDGTIRHVIEKGRAVYDKENQPLWLDGIILDITEKVRTEQRLKEKDLLLSSIVENTTDAVFLKDMKGRYLMANKATLQAIGLPESEVIGRTDMALFPERSAEVITQTDSVVITSGKPMIVEHKLETSYGETYWQSNKSLLRDGAGNIVGLIGISRNINDLKQIQEQNKELEKKLIQAQKLESIGNLSGGIAHDFNNILFPIVGMSELLLEDLPPNSPEYQKVRSILNAGKRGSELVRQILSFSRKSDNKMLPVRVQKILKEVLNLAKATIPTYIEITHNIQPDCAFVMADPIQIHQVAMNLITNAFHAMESEGGTLSITLREMTSEAGDPVPPELESSGCIRLSVADTGCGIPPEVIDKIFDPYFTTKEQGKGTGLGLSVVYGIIKNHGGDIKVHSQPGKGSVFDIYLPIADDAAVESVSHTPAAFHSGNEHILLVDDEEAVAHLETQILERLGYRVTCCTDSQDAFDLFQRDPDSIDIVISDMTMPKMRGDILADKLLAIRPELPIIICTGFSEKMTEEISDSIGIKGFIMKPATRDELAEMVRKVLDEAKGKQT